MPHILALDQGTTSSRALVVDTRMAVLGIGQEELPQHYPAPGLVEHDGEDIWRTTLSTARRAMAAAGVEAHDIAAIGITNQRETCLLWDRATGKPLHRAIVWQDRRTADICRRLREEGGEAMVAAKTGLLLDPYFSATKLAWLLDTVEGARTAAEAGRLAFGTVDTFLLWRLTGGKVHATDATNAARTSLLDIHRGAWDDDLLRLFRIPRAVLPEVRDCAADFGETEPALFGAAIPVLAMAGDQQAATMGQACFEPGMAKATYGTGCFALLVTGETAVASRNRLLTTIAWQLDGRRTYALEGSIFVAGAAVQWLRDGLHLIGEAAESGALAAAADPAQDVYMVPAFVGLGAPHWDADARGALLGLTRGTGRAEIARAALEAVCFQTRDLLDAMQADLRTVADRAGTGAGGAAETVLRVDGGMVASDWMMQRLADLTGAPVDRAERAEATALGVAWLAGHRAGVSGGQDRFAEAWQRDRRFSPLLAENERERRLAGWRRAVAAVKVFAGH
jgi:glycerol kinase